MTEARLTTLLLKKIKQEKPFNQIIWAEIKKAEYDKPFYFSALSEKARRLLTNKSLLCKFSDMAGETPLDIIYVPQVSPLLCIIWYKPRSHKKAYFLKPPLEYPIKITQEDAKEKAIYQINF